VTSKPCRLPPDRLNTYGMVMHTACLKARYGVLRIHPKITSCPLSSAGGAAYLPARPHGKNEASTCGDRGSRALASLGHRCPVSDVDRVANRAGIHFRRAPLFSSPKVLLHLAVEGWTRWSNTACAPLREPGPMSPSRVAETLANGLVAGTLFCDLLVKLRLHLETQ
jgi:hypothetical protein